MTHACENITFRFASGNKWKYKQFLYTISIYRYCVQQTSMVVKMTHVSKPYQFYFKKIFCLSKYQGFYKYYRQESIPVGCVPPAVQKPLDEDPLTPNAEPFPCMQTPLSCDQ